MKWKDLSDEAKSILEWLEDPFTGKKQTLTIINNSIAKICGKMINIDLKLFNEMKRHCNAREDIEVSIVDDTMKVRLK